MFNTLRNCHYLLRGLFFIVEDTEIEIDNIYLYIPFVRFYEYFQFTACLII